MNEDYQDYDFEDSEEIKEFICPECGSKETGEKLFLSKEPLPQKNTKDPWSSILQQIECIKCKMIIPIHLAERWDNISYSKAQEEWNKIFRKDSKKQKF